jgi:hypothetical protein
MIQTLMPNGVNQPFWLGYVSIDTTNIYAESDLEMKAKALGMCEAKLPRERRRWRDNPELLTFLAQL